MGSGGGKAAKVMGNLYRVSVDVRLYSSVMVKTSWVPASDCCLFVLCPSQTDRQTDRHICTLAGCKDMECMHVFSQGSTLEWLGDWDTNYLLLLYVALTPACVIPMCLSLSSMHT